MTASKTHEMFDQAARDRIRRKLRDHMTGHGIGVHKLAERIQGAQPHKNEIPIKTLQRFLAGSHRTNDSYVGNFRQFADGLPDADPVGELGRAMAAFHDAEESDHFVGSYTLTFNENRSPDGALDVAYLGAKADSRFCRVTERFTVQRLIVSDGVLVSRGDTAIIVLRDRLTKSPTEYLLTTKGDSHWICGTQAVYEPDTQSRVRTVTAEAHRFSPREGEEMPASASVAVTMPSPTIPSPGRVLGDLVQSIRRMLGKGMTRLRTSSARPIPMANRHDEIRVPVTASADSIKAAAMRDTASAVRQSMKSDEMRRAFLRAAEQADEAGLRRLVEAGADINEPDAQTGLTALHFCVGRNAFDLTRYLVAAGAAFVPDKFGRMPSTIAVECEVSDELVDFIVEAEAAAEGV